MVGADPGAAPLPRQVSQDSARGNWIDVSVPRADFLERDLEVVAEVRALLRSTAPPAAAEHIAEAEEIAQAAEDVLEAGEGGRIEAALRADAGMAEAIVGGALLRIATAPRTPRPLP